MTPQELIAKWRKQSEQVNAVATNPLNRDSAIDAGLADGLLVCADELASTLSTMRCETCKFAGAVYEERRVRFERDGYESPGARVCHGLGYVPLTTADGQPFSCSAWAASPPLEKGRE